MKDVYCIQHFADHPIVSFIFYIQNSLNKVGCFFFNKKMSAPLHTSLADSAFD